MPDRSRDWLAQAERDFQQAMASKEQERHEWACFAAHQSAEKAVKALHLANSQAAKGHMVARLLAELPSPAPEDLINKSRFLDNHYIPTRYPTVIRKVLRSSTTVQSKVHRRSDMPVRSLNMSVLG